MIGKIIKIDRSTSVYDKGEFARICVEVDLQKPLLPAFTTFREDKQLVYEGLHMVCFGCRLYGHVQEKCSNRTMEGGVQVPQEEMGGKCGGQQQSRKAHEEAKQSVGADGTGMASGNVTCGSAKSSKGVHLSEIVIGDVNRDGEKRSFGEHSKVLEDDTEFRLGERRPLTTEHGVSDRFEHLGPRMIFSRDLRRGGYGRTNFVGKKGGVLVMAQGSKLMASNQEGSRVLGDLMAMREGPTILAKGEAISKFKEEGKLKNEGVVVGSKRKKEEKTKRFGKEIKGIGRSKAKLKELVSSGDHIINKTNAFSSLQELTPTCESLMLGNEIANANLEHVMTSQKHNECHLVHTSGTDEEPGSVAMDDSDMGIEEKEFERKDMDNPRGSGLGPTSIIQS